MPRPQLRQTGASLRRWTAGCRKRPLRSGDDGMGIRARDILLSAAALRMAALLVVGVGAILAAPTLYAQLIALRESSMVVDDTVWTLPPPPRSLIEGARSVSTEDATASIPRSVAPPRATTVLLNGDRPATAQPSIAAPAASPPHVADAPPMTDAPSLPPSPVIPSVEDLLAETLASRARPAAVPLPPRRVATVPPTRLAALTPPGGSPLVRAPVHAPVAARPASLHQGAPLAHAAPPRTDIATTQPPAYLLHSPEPSPQSQRIPVLSNVMDGINSMGQAITSVVPKF